MQPKNILIKKLTSKLQRTANIVFFIILIYYSKFIQQTNTYTCRRKLLYYEKFNIKIVGRIYSPKIYLDVSPKYMMLRKTYYQNYNEQVTLCFHVILISL